MPPRRRMAWPAAEKRKLQAVYIMSAYCEVREREPTSSDLCHHMLETYKRLVKNMTEIPVAARHYTVEDVQNEMLLIDRRNTCSGKQLWYRAKTISKVRPPPTCIHSIIDSVCSGLPGHRFVHRGTRAFGLWNDG